MTPTHRGSIRLFRLAGIEVYLHWSWFLVAYYGISSRSNIYDSAIWNVVEYLALFAIVVLHEFGHSLACRQVGGKGDNIVLWPLGGVAYVHPPQRPGATLWSIVAGPLVNVVLGAACFVAVLVMGASNIPNVAPDVYRLVRVLLLINIGLLVFNLLPIYPLDGGQILRSLLWFPLGYVRSLIAATFIGFVGVAGLILLAIYLESVWIGIMAAFILLNCWSGMRHGLALRRMAKAPRHADVACPLCQSPPPAGDFWVCGRCRTAFDMFATAGICPTCQAAALGTYCAQCGAASPLGLWFRHPEMGPPAPPEPMLETYEDDVAGPTESESPA